MNRKDDGDFDKAIIDFTQAITINRNYASAYTNRGTVYMELAEQRDGDPDKAILDKAIGDFTNAIKLLREYISTSHNPRGNPGDRGREIINFTHDSAESKLANTYYNRGFAFNKRGREDEDDYQNAIRDFSEAINYEFEPRAKAYFHRGIAHNNQVNYEEAIDLNYKPRSFAFNNRGRAYLDRGESDDLEQAIRDINEAISIDDKNAQAYYNRGIALIKRGGESDLTDAKKAFEKCRQLTSDESFREDVQEWIEYLKGQEN